jgi:hypothetical protein
MNNKTYIWFNCLSDVWTKRENVCFWFGEVDSKNLGAFIIYLFLVLLFNLPLHDTIQN